MADFEAGVWAGGSKQGDPGWGDLNTAKDAPANSNNPSLKVAFAFGILKTDPTKWGLRMADAATASDLSTAYEGNLPKAMSNLGGIVLGVGGDNSNNSYGTFYEGAIVSGYPSAATDLAVFKNVKAVGYTK
jgi:non-reducing end alpha-L-arabinofuranosidase